MKPLLKAYRPPCLPTKRPKDTRPSASKRGYGAKWRKRRAAYLTKFPWCVECLKRGRKTKATDVDHRVPLERGGVDDESNYDSHCHSHHSRKTAKHDGGFGRRNKSKYLNPLTYRPGATPPVDPADLQ